MTYNKIAWSQEQSSTEPNNNKISKQWKKWTKIAHNNNHHITDRHPFCFVYCFCTEIPRKRLKGCTKALRRNFDAFLHNIRQTEGISLSQLTPLFLKRHDHSLAIALNCSKSMRCSRGSPLPGDFSITDLSWTSARHRQKGFDYEEFHRIRGYIL